MGFKCPKCHQDFGLNKEKLAKHFLSNPKCSVHASTLYSVLREALDNVIVEPEEE